MLVPTFSWAPVSIIALGPAHPAAVDHHVLVELKAADSGSNAVGLPVLHLPDYQLRFGRSVVGVGVVDGPAEAWLVWSIRTIRRGAAFSSLILFMVESWVFPRDLSSDVRHPFVLLRTVIRDLRA